MPEDFLDVVAEIDAQCRKRDIRMIGPEKAFRLVQLVQQHKPKRVVEVGTAIGYSGLWISSCLQLLGDGRLITIEQDQDRAAEAGRYFRQAGVEQLVTQLIGDARELVTNVEGPVDFLFLDGGFENYYPCFEGIRPRLKDGALLVADNAGIGAIEMADYLDHVRTSYESRIEWFDVDLPWNQRDAMEVSVFRR
jgi:predicted O-methyltransferase YrrM